MRVGVAHGCMLMPMTVLAGRDGQVMFMVVMQIIMPVGVVMEQPLMAMLMPMTVAIHHNKGANQYDSGYDLVCRQAFTQDQDGKEHSDEWRCGEQRLASSGPELLGGRDIERNAYTVRERPKDETSKNVQWSRGKWLRYQANEKVGAARHDSFDERAIGRSYAVD